MDLLPLNEDLLHNIFRRCDHSILMMARLANHKLSHVASYYLFRVALVSHNATDMVRFRKVADNVRFSLGVENLSFALFLVMTAVLRTKRE